MTNATYTFEVDDELKDQFSKTAKALNQSSSELIRGFMREFVRQYETGNTGIKNRDNYDDWFRHQVKIGLNSAAEGRLIPSTEVEDLFKAKRAESASRLSPKK